MLLSKKRLQFEMITLHYLLIKETALTRVHELVILDTFFIKLALS